MGQELQTSTGSRRIKIFVISSVPELGMSFCSCVNPKKLAQSIAR